MPKLSLANVHHGIEPGLGRACPLALRFLGKAATSCCQVQSVNKVLITVLESIYAALKIPSGLGAVQFLVNGLTQHRGETP